MLVIHDNSVLIRCFIFKIQADGYGRSEGAVLMFLQRAQDAKRSYGTLKFSDCFYLGLSPHTFLGYDEHVLETSLREIYSKYDNVKPSDVSFVEMDACGVKVGLMYCRILNRIRSPVKAEIE